MSFIKAAKNQFLYYKTLAEKAIDQISEEQLLHKISPESNSIGQIINHLRGNMLSRWTDFLTTDGEKGWRNRDQEFEEIIVSKKELMQSWDEGWMCLFQALDQVTEQNIHQVIYIRNIGLSVEDAILRQLAHYPHHIGQIVFIAKALKDEHWKSLSIPKGNSNQYNADKFSREKAEGDYTSELIKELQK